MRTVLITTERNTLQELGQLCAAAAAAGEDRPDLVCLGRPPEGAGQLALGCIFQLEATGCWLAQAVARQLLPQLTALRPSLVLGMADDFGNQLMSWLADGLQAPCGLAITALRAEQPSGCWKFQRRVYGLSLEAEYACEGAVACFTLSPDRFAPLLKPGKAELLSWPMVLQAPWCIHWEQQPLETARGLEDEPLVLIGGAGLGSRETAEKLRRLAAAYGAGVGATRPAVFSGWFERERLVGASGLRLRAKRCVIFGASGCPPLLAGIERCAYILAINQDPNAPIFEYCDEGLVADCRQVIDQLLERACPHEDKPDIES